MMMGKTRSAAKPKPGQDGLTVDDVTVTYRNGHTALRRASFSIPKGTITALVGVNGAGKSTIFKAIMGFVPLSAGTVSIFGEPASTALKKNLVAYVPQAEEVDWSFPVLVEDVVMMGRYGHMNFFRIPTKRDHRWWKRRSRASTCWITASARSASFPAGRRNASFSPAPWRRKARSFCSTSPLPAST